MILIQREIDVCLIDYLSSQYLNETFVYFLHILNSAGKWFQNAESIFSCQR